MDQSHKNVIVRWGSNLGQDEILMYSEKKNKGLTKNPYKFNDLINSKLSICYGDIEKIEADCVATQAAKNVFSAKGDREKFCGDKLVEDLNKYDGTLTLSNCFVTNCYNLKFKKIIHTMLPKFSSNHKIACESSLHQAIRNLFDMMIQQNIKSVCISNDIFQPSKNFPKITAITIILRTFRRCLEKLYEKIDQIIFCVNDIEIYNRLVENLKIFFPRSKEEEDFMSKYVPIVNETEYGDIIVPERNIDILSNFKSNSNTTKKAAITLENRNDYIHNYDIYRNDDQRLFNTICDNSDFIRVFYQENSKKYSIDQCKELELMKFILYKGKDVYKRKIFLIDLKRLDFNELYQKDYTDLLLLFLIKYFQGFYSTDENVERFSLLVSLNEINKSNHPSIYFIKTLMKILNCYININWANIEIVFLEPSTVFKLYFWIFRIYIPLEIWNRIVYYKDSDELKKNYEISSDELKMNSNLKLISTECTVYEKKENQENYKNLDL